MKREDVFERLEPPGGGIAKLRERMTARPSSIARARARRLVPVAAALAIAAVVLLFWSRRTTPDLVAAARHRAGLEQVALGLAPSPRGGSAALTDEERATTALAEVPTSSRTVAFYWVSSTAWTE